MWDVRCIVVDKKRVLESVVSYKTNVFVRKSNVMFKKFIKLIAKTYLPWLSCKVWYISGAAGTFLQQMDSLKQIIGAVRRWWLHCVFSYFSWSEMSRAGAPRIICIRYTLLFFVFVFHSKTVSIYMLYFSRGFTQ